MLRTANGKFWRDSVEITAQEYASALAEIKEKVSWVERIVAGQATMVFLPA